MAKIDVPSILSGGILKGQRTYLLGFGLMAQALAQWLAGDLSLSGFLEALPEIFGGMGLMALRAGVEKAVGPVKAIEAAVLKTPAEPGQ